MLNALPPCGGSRNPALPSVPSSSSLPVPVASLRLVAGFQLTNEAAQAADVDPQTVVRRWLDAKSPSARRTYAGALSRFAAWAIEQQDAGPHHALRVLCEAGPGAAHSMVERWRDSMLAAGLSTGTVAGRCAALSSLVSCCRRAGLVTWALEGVAPRVEQRQDRSGPRRHEVARLVECIDAAAATGDPQAARDAAVVRLLFCAGLRRSEAGQLRVEDVDLDAGTVAPRRKGKRERSRVSITAGTVEAIRRWLQLRGDAVGWLFVRTDRADESRPLSGESVRRLLRSWAAQAGVRATIRPHGLRHSGATEVAARGSLASLMAYGGWSSMTSASRYLDRRAQYRAEALELVDL
jgi:integrase/recombinase XerC